MNEWLIAAVVGTLSGMAASLGLGGGFVLLLYLTTLANMPQLEAQGLNLLFFLPIAALSLLLHQKNKLIEKTPILPAVLSGTVGAGIGVFAAQAIPTFWLSKLFAVFILVLGIKEVFFTKEKAAPKAKGR